MDALVEMEKAASSIRLRSIFEIVKDNDAKIVAPYIGLISEESKKRLLSNYSGCIVEGFQESYAYSELLIDIFSFAILDARNPI